MGAGWFGGFGGVLSGLLSGRWRGYLAGEDGEVGDVVGVGEAEAVSEVVPEGDFVAFAGF